MKIPAVLFLSCALAHGMDEGIQIFSSTKTNKEAASVSIREIFTRGGQTNLVRNTKTKAGVIQIQTHQFYHHNQLVGDFVTTQNASGFTTEAGTPYSMSFEFDKARKIKAVVIAKDGALLDVFNYTNGVFIPIENAKIAKANSVGSEVQTAIQELREKQK